MKRVVFKLLGGTDLHTFEKNHDLTYHKILDNATVYVAGKNDEYVLLVNNEWESRFTEVGEYKEEKVDKL